MKIAHTKFGIAGTTCTKCGKEVVIGGTLKNYRWKMYYQGKTKYFCSYTCYMSEYKKIKHPQSMGDVKRR